MDRALKASPTIPNTQVRKMSLYGFFEIRRHNVYKTMCQKSPLLKVINLLLNVLIYLVCLIVFEIVFPATNNS